MRKTDIEAVGELAGEALAAGGTLIKDMHTVYEQMRTWITRTPARR
jgi:hypothetical protein